MRAFLQLLALLAIVLTLGGCPDSRCSATNCIAMVDSCRVQLCGVPANTACFRIPGATGDGGVDLVQYCVQVCQSQGAGRVVGCVADHAQACVAAFLDGGSAARDAVVAQCAAPYDGGSPSLACTQACDSQKTSCYGSCSTTDAKACFDCSSTCDVNWCNCYDKCPTS